MKIIKWNFHRKIIREREGRTIWIEKETSVSISFASLTIWGEILPRNAFYSCWHFNNVVCRGCRLLKVLNLFSYLRLHRARGVEESNSNSLLVWNIKMSSVLLRFMNLYSLQIERVGGKYEACYLGILKGSIIRGKMEFEPVVWVFVFGFQ